MNIKNMLPCALEPNTPQEIGSIAMGYYRPRFTPPFRAGGRGSKQLSKAVELTQAQSIEKGEDSSFLWVIYVGRHAFFGKFISRSANTCLIQQMLPGSDDKKILFLREGHLKSVNAQLVFRIQVLKKFNFMFLHN